MFARGSSFIVAPSSPEGSYHPSSCSCSEAGGFESGSAVGMIGTGCTPCLDGYFSGPGSMDGCQPCPKNTYSTVTADLRDFLKCPNSTSPALHFPLQVSSRDDSCFTVRIGATYCTSCPPDKPYTLASASSSKAMCRTCPPDQYLDPVTKICIKCIDACQKGFYQTSQCTDKTPRFVIFFLFYHLVLGFITLQKADKPEKQDLPEV
jgi:hypothetical protein